MRSLFLILTACAPGGSFGPDAPGVPTDGGTESTGVVPTAPDPGDGPTWYQDVAPLMADRCGACHIDGGIAPFSVATYEQALPWGPAMAASIEAGTMPPFFASDDEVCEERLDLVDDVRLSEDDKQLVYDWVDAGMPEGDPESAADAELRPVVALDPVDAELAIAEPFEVDGTRDIYECFRIPLNLSEDVYLTGLQVIPGSEAVVHHVLVWSDPNDQSQDQAGADGHYPCSGFPDILPTELVAAWSPGAQATRTPPGSGTPLEQGSSLVLNIHYHPTGTTREIDQTRIRLQWTTEPPEMHATWYLVDWPFGAMIQPGPNDRGGTEFRIPAGESNHMETEELWLPPVLFDDLIIFAVAPHMHYLGTDQLVTLDHTDPNDPDQCLVHTPGFRYDFQQGYAFDAPVDELPVFHPGDRIRVQCMYDNSASNPFLPLQLEAAGRDTVGDVYWGEETGDEMCMAMVGFLTPPDAFSLMDWF